MHYGQHTAFCVIGSAVEWHSDADAAGMIARLNAMLDRQIADASATRSLTLAFPSVACGSSNGLAFCGSHTGAFDAEVAQCSPQRVSIHTDGSSVSGGDMGDLGQGVCHADKNIAIGCRCENQSNGQHVSIKQYFPTHRVLSGAVVEAKETRAKESNRQVSIRSFFTQQLLITHFFAAKDTVCCKTQKKEAACPDDRRPGIIQKIHCLKRWVAPARPVFHFRHSVGQADVWTMSFLLVCC